MLVTCSRKEILCSANVHPSNRICMSQQSQLPNTSSHIPYAHAFIFWAGNKQFRVAGKERNRINSALQNEKEKKIVNIVD